MADLRETAVGDFLAQLASDAPAPGGGAVAALAGAQAAALVAMVARLTLGKKPEEAADLAATLARAEELSRGLTEMVDRDTGAFLEVMSAYRLPKDDPGRPEAIRESLRRAAEVPLEVARRAAEVAGLAEQVIERGIASARTDAAVAALMARTAVEGAALNVLINLGSLKDPGYVEAAAREVDTLLQRGRAVSGAVEGVFAALRGKLPGPA